MNIRLRTANMYPSTPLADNFEAGLCETARREGSKSTTIVDEFKLDIDTAPILADGYLTFKVGSLATCPFSDICPAGAGCSNPDVLAPKEDAADLIERFPESVNNKSLARIVGIGGTVLPIQLISRNPGVPDSIPDKWFKEFGSSEE